MVKDKYTYLQDTNGKNCKTPMGKKLKIQMNGNIARVHNSEELTLKISILHQTTYKFNLIKIIENTLILEKIEGRRRRG